MSSPDLGPEHLPTVPHLKSNGSNWVAFAMRFQEVMLAAYRWVYIVGTTTRPVPKDADNPTRAEKEATEAWEDEDQFTGYLLSTKLPDWLAISIHSYPIYSTAKTQWDKVIEELRHEGRDTHTQIVSAEAILSQHHTQVPDPKVHAQTVGTEPEAISGKPDAIEDVAHTHHNRAEPDIHSRQPGDPNAFESLLQSRTRHQGKKPTHTPVCTLKAQGKNPRWTRRRTTRSRWRRRRSPGKTPASSGTWVPASSCNTPGSAPLPHKRTSGRSLHCHHPQPRRLLACSAHRLLARSAHRLLTWGHWPPQTT